MLGWDGMGCWAVAVKFRTNTFSSTCRMPTPPPSSCPSAVSGNPTERKQASKQASRQKEAFRIYHFRMWGMGGGGAAEMARRVASGMGDPQQLAGDKAFLAASWQRLQAWVRWFNTTQAGVLPGSFFWHGRRADSDTELNPKVRFNNLPTSLLPP